MPPFPPKVLAVRVRIQVVHHQVDLPIRQTPELVMDAPLGQPLTCPKP